MSSESRFFVLDPNKSKNVKKVYDDSHKVMISLYDYYTGITGIDVKPLLIYGPITGYMTEQFSYSMRADYEKMFNASSIFPGVQNIVSMDRGENLGKMGYATKQFYTGSGYVEIGVKIRFHNDWIDEQRSEGEGGVTTALETANILLASVMPSANMKNNPGMFQEYDSGIVNSSFQVVNGILSAATNKDADFLGKNPPLVEIEIGNYFKKTHMTVRSVNISLSQEFMKFKKRGTEYREPLYVDVDMALTSMYAATVSSHDESNDVLWDKYGTGFKRSDLKSRAEIIEGIPQALKSVGSGFVDAGKAAYGGVRDVTGFGDGR